MKATQSPENSLNDDPGEEQRFDLSLAVADGPVQQVIQRASHFHNCGSPSQTESFDQVHVEYSAA